MVGEKPAGGKKRGRPRKMRNEHSPGAASAGAAAARNQGTPSPPPAVRRSRRRRRPRRARDFADYGDEDDDFYWWELSTDEESGKKKAEEDGARSDDLEPRKFRLLRKLPPQSTGRVRRGGGSQSDGSDSSSKEEEDEVGGRDSIQKCDQPATVSTPLPEKKTLEDVLDKLQKKDIYGVYAEPVDPEELPDYHDIIKHPMDFGTIRKKLADGAYSDLKKFESDVFLLCTNAMQYNAPDTIYFRQAHSIQELARKKFQSIRLCREEVIKSEGKNLQNSLAKNLISGSLDEIARHPARALASNSDISSGLIALQTRVPEQPASISGNMDGSSTCENKFVRGEDNSARNPPKPEVKPDAFYEDHRATYSLPVEQHVVGPHLPFSFFENEQRRLIAVGLEGGQHPYARSLARFAGPLGPTAWRIASQRIEKALPEGVGFGPGWVGEYEPLHQGPYFLNKAENQRESLMDDEAGPVTSGRSSVRVPVGPTIMEAVNGGGDVPEVGSTGCGSPGWGPRRWHGFDLGPARQNATTFVQHKSTASASGDSQRTKFGMGVADRSRPDAGMISGGGGGGSQPEIFKWVGALSSASQISQLSDARFGQTFAGRGNPVSHLDPGLFADGNLSQTLAGSSARVLGDGRFSQTLAASGNPSSHSQTGVPADGRFGQTLAGSSNRVLADERFGQTLAASGNPSSHLDTRALADGRFGQTFAGSGSQISLLDTRALAGGRFGQTHGGNANPGSHLDPRVLADGRFGQTLAARGNQSAQSGFIPPSQTIGSHGGHDRAGGSPINLIRGILEGPSNQLTFPKSTTVVENPNLPVRNSPIDAVTTAAPTRMSVGRSLSGQAPPQPPPPGSASNFLNMEGRGIPPESPAQGPRFHGQSQLGGATGEEERWPQNRNFAELTPQVNLAVFPRQACWQGLTPHGQEPKNDGGTPDLNVGGFHAPRLPAQQPPGIRVDPPQPDLALQL